MTRSSTHPFVQPLRFASGLGTVLVALLDWAERRRQRRALEALSDAGLKDIGLSRADVARELAKWPWER
jgi:uncharacterized protein YjiS (DUF1127 family)